MKKKSNFEHGGDLKKAKKEFSLEEKGIMDFSANINFLGPPPEIMETIKDNLEEIQHYPQPHSEELKKVLGDKFSLSQEQVIVGNGAVEIIYLLLEYLNIENIVLPVPSFSEYEKAARKIEAELDFFYLDEKNIFSLEINRLKKYIFRNDLIILCNPHNPTAKLYTKKEVLEIVKIAQKENSFVLIDEAFIDFITEKSKYSLVSELDKYPNLFIIRSMTKFFAIPGLRLGFGLGNSEIITELEKRRDPWTVNTLAQIAGIKALEEREYIKKTQKENVKEREFLFSKLKNINKIKVFEPTANFILVKLKNKLRASELKKRMAKRGVLIRDCSNFRGLDDSYFRLAVKSRKMNLEMLEILKNSLES